MIKVIGGIIVLVTTTGYGLQVSRAYIKRVKEIRQIILSLQMIETEMSYSQLPLQTIFNNISIKLTSPINLLYKNISNEMDQTVEVFSEIWEIHLDNLLSISHLQKSDIEIMKQFGATLGNHTFTQQQKHITLTIKHLEKQLEEAQEQRDIYGKMSKTIGVLTGLVIVILFF